MTPTEREQMMCDAIVWAVLLATAAPSPGVHAVLADHGAEASAYPFCDTSKCPWWRGYCSRDPACDD